MGELLQGWSQNKLMYKVPFLTQRANLANSRETEVNPSPLSPQSHWDLTDPLEAQEERWTHPHRHQPSLVLPWYLPNVFLSLTSAQVGSGMQIGNCSAVLAPIHLKNERLYWSLHSTGKPSPPHSCEPDRVVPANRETHWPQEEAWSEQTHSPSNIRQHLDGLWVSTGKYSLKVNMCIYSSYYDRHLKTLNSKIRHLK